MGAALLAVKERAERKPTDDQPLARASNTRRANTPALSDESQAPPRNGNALLQSIPERINRRRGAGFGRLPYYQRPSSLFFRLDAQAAEADPFFPVCWSLAHERGHF